MRWILCIVLATFASCTGKSNSDAPNTGEITSSIINNRIEQIPPDGTYRYDIAFAEWDGRSMGEKVTVSIKGDFIRVVYEGDGKLTAEKGEVLDVGRILKHKSGVWIIGNDEQDAKKDEIGGCSDGPRIIDFENKKFWTC